MIYVASKTVHAAMWRDFRAAGAPINSTWIDEAGAGETSDFADLWRRCIRESQQATCLVLYREPNEILKGALVEVGSALGAGVRVIFAGDPEGLGSFLQHPNVERAAGVGPAMVRAALYDAEAQAKRSRPRAAREGELVDG